MNPAGHDRLASSEGEAPINPLKKAFDDFRQRAPAVTQTLMMTSLISWVLGNFILRKYVLECVPYFIFRHFEMYRLLTSVLVNPGLFANLFACLLMAQHCRTLEQSIGSAATLWLFLGVFTVMVNVLYCLLQAFLAGMLSDADEPAIVMSWEAPGLWTGLLGTITVEACRAAAIQQQRSLCSSFKVPTKLFPLCLLMAVMVMTRSSITLLVATGLGYFIGHNLDTNGVLAAPSSFVTFVDTQFRGSQGWIGATASLGSEAWMRESEVCTNFSLWSIS
jgi:membrane associated rhomboid family serine protease